MASPTIEIQITAPLTDAHKSVLTPDAVAFLKKLSSTFEERRQQCLAQRREKQARIDKGELPDFLAGNRERAQSGLVCRVHSQGSDGPARGNYRARGPQDDYQRAQLRRGSIHGGFRGFEFADLDATTWTATSIFATP